MDLKHFRHLILYLPQSAPPWSEWNNRFESFVEFSAASISNSNSINNFKVECSC